MSELREYILAHEDAFKSKSRLASLYSDFSILRTTNPDGYAANIAAWRAALTNATRAGVAPQANLLALSESASLASCLAGPGLGRPLALQEVLDDCVATKAMIPLDAFLHSKTSVYQRSWIPQLPTPWTVARWGLRRVGLLGGNTLAHGDLVVTANVEQAAARIIDSSRSSLSTQGSLVFSSETFKARFSNVLSSTRPLTTTDVQVLVTYLSREKSVATTSSTPNGFSTIKFNFTSPPSPVTDHDTTIATLNTLILTLERQISALSTRISTLTAEAKAAVSSSQKSLALSALRSKKLAETTLQKRTDSLAQVESTLASIDDAANQLEMVKAMEGSAEVLRQMNKDIGGVERVDDVMENLRERMADTEEISRVLREDGTAEIDEGEIDDELQTLLDEQKIRISESESVKEKDTTKETDSGKKEEIAKQVEPKTSDATLANLPSVPTTDPGTSNAEEILEKGLSGMSLEDDPVSITVHANSEQEQVVNS